MSSGSGLDALISEGEQASPVQLLVLDTKRQLLDAQLRALLVAPAESSSSLYCYDLVVADETQKVCTLIESL